MDLGSNSFRMVLAAVVDGGLRRVDSLREGVRLAAALGPDGRLTPEGEARALACLERFGQRLRDLPPDNVRAVGTNTLRRARGARTFLRRARAALGHPVEVISGHEEARLVYRGVSSDLGPGEGRRLVIDVGGGSTECILGRGQTPLRTESLYIGCVGLTLAHFADGRVRREAMRKAELAAGQELEGLAEEWRGLGWDTCAGSSGTVRAIAAVARRNGWNGEGVTPRALEKVRRALLDAGEVAAVRLPGLSRERAAVLPGGIAILAAAFQAFGIERMTASSGSLREGLLLDLLGRRGTSDVRPQSLRRLQELYRVDAEQAARVERTALGLLRQAARAWELEDPAWASWLAWAARVHEIGLAVAHGGYHKHGEYLLTHADIPGFSLQEQRMLAVMVRGHRRKLPAELFADLPEELCAPATRLALLLRLAVLLHRSRAGREPEAVELQVGEDSLRLRLPAGWLEERPLTAADLEQEAGWLASAGWRLSWQ